jgi:ribosomal protein S18 acetylase RimI-like enzyme
MVLEFRQVEVKEADPALLSEVTALINVANTVFSRLFPGERLEPNTIADKHREYNLVTVYEDGLLIATMSTIAVDGGLKVELLAVAPEAQGRQVAKLVLDQAGSIAESLGLPKVWLEAVEIGNLVPYYKKLGFTEDLRRRMPLGYWDSFEEFDLVTLSRPI